MYYFLNEKLIFPPVDRADEQGILAIGGDLSAERLLLAYSSGIFPWFSEDDPIIWWSPDPRFVMYPAELNISKSMAQVLRKQLFKITFDTNFRAVITACQQVKREGQSGTWITDDMLEAYCNLHSLGYAHSAEAWQEGRLVGGVYGVSLGKAFFGESMFAHVSNASKTAYITLVQKLQKNNFQIIDCQVYTEHLESLGAVSIPRNLFLEQIGKALAEDTMQGSWQGL
ncbi:MAG: leucyl/phenylalanyl-tRNA--protein transferase [Cytophagales bacterium]|nr:MAG: leucyl/phenylalanyl-tRNA--protein transferase [Cytophagales bacterium]